MKYIKKNINICGVVVRYSASTNIAKIRIPTDGNEFDMFEKPGGFRAVRPEDLQLNKWKSIDDFRNFLKAAMWIETACKQTPTAALSTSLSCARTTDIESTLVSLLQSKEGKDKQQVWLKHFKGLEDKTKRSEYSIFRSKLISLIGRDLREFNLCVPLSTVGNNSIQINIQYAGRIIASIKSSTRSELTYRCARIHDDMQKKWISLDSDGLAALKKILQMAERDNRYREWQLQAAMWRRLQQPVKPFRYIQPVHYERMFLQISSMFSASKKILLAGAGANAHSDILARFGRGNTSKLAVLELKVAGQAKNVEKSLTQAFAYAFLYHAAFNKIGHFEEKDRSIVLNVLRYENPKWTEKPPKPIYAIAVVPKGSKGKVINQAKADGVFDSPSVKNGYVSLWTWEYEEKDGEYVFFEHKVKT